MDMEENINGVKYDTSLDLYIKGFLFIILSWFVAYMTV